MQEHEDRRYDGVKDWTNTFILPEGVSPYLTLASQLFVSVLT